MKKTTFVCLVLCLLLCRANLFSQSFFQSLGGPPGGAEEQQIGLMNNGDLVAAGYSAVYRRSPGAAKWQRLTGFPDENVAYYHRVRVGLDGNLYVFGNDKKLWRSTDAGSTWTVLNPNFQIAATLRQILILPNGRIIQLAPKELLYTDDYGATMHSTLQSTATTWVYWGFKRQPNGSLLLSVRRESAGIGALVLFRGTDNGTNWQEVFTSSYSITNFIYGFAETTAGALFATDNAGLHRSLDGGATWEVIPHPGAYSPLKLEAGQNGRVLVFNEFEWFFSDDSGASWTPCQTGKFHKIQSITLTPDGKMYGIGGPYASESLYRSDDNGASWQAFSEGTSNSIVRKIFEKTPGELYAAAETGLWRTTDGGATWENRLQNSVDPTLSPGNQVTFGGIQTAGQRIFLQMSGRLLHSDDNGASWQTNAPPILQHLDTAVFNFFINPDTSGPSFLFGRSFSPPQRWVFRSSDNGTSWQQITAPPEINSTLALPNGQLLAWGLAGIFRSSDGGSTWTSLPTGNGSWDIRLGLDGKLYALGNLEFFISADNADSWQPIFMPPVQWVEALAINELGHIYMAGQWFSSGEKIYRSFDGGTTWSDIPFEHPVSSLDFLPDGHLYVGSAFAGVFKSRYPLNQFAEIRGRIVRDENADCLPDSADASLRGIIVEADGIFDFYAKTDTLGNYSIKVDTGAYLVRPRLWNNLYQNCQQPRTVALTDPFQVVDSVDFAIETILDCPWFEVSLSTPLLRRCFENIYHASFCNYGTVDQPDAVGLVLLDPRLEFLSASIPHTTSGDTLRFELGDLPVGACKNFNFKVKPTCDSTTFFGPTLCATALIYPDSSCEQPSQQWSGAHVEVEVACVGDTTVQFKVKNTGTAPTSPGLEYLIIEDQIVLRSGPVNLGPGASMVFSEPAEGTTWRIEAEQEPFHPGFSAPAAVVEGCGGMGSSGFFNQLPPDDADPFVDIECQRVVGSYDPNDKQANPEGFGNQHFIKKNTDIEYRIRFQNTGTDTAFRVVVVDTLSVLLDPGRLRVGTASHPFEWTLEGGGVLKFTFENILLPDSNVNEPASHGFVIFRIAQDSNLAVGTVIQNEAAIYFDFNDPVFTNETFHSIEDKFLTVSILEPEKLAAEVLVAPNPFADEAVFILKKNVPGGEKTLRLLTTDGREVLRKNFTGDRVAVRGVALSAGIYWFEISVGQKTLAAGKVVVE